LRRPHAPRLDAAIAAALDIKTSLPASGDARGGAAGDA